MFWYGHPLVAEGAGRIKTDPINEQRIEQALDRFESWAKNNGVGHQLRWTVTKDQAKTAQVAFPLVGLALGQLGSHLFVHPNSHYVGKFFTVLTTYLGYHFSKSYVQAYNCSRRVGNIPAYPEEIRAMLENNDARYAFKWLKTDSHPNESPK